MFPKYWYEKEPKRAYDPRIPESKPFKFGDAWSSSEMFDKRMGQKDVSKLIIKDMWVKACRVFTGKPAPSKVKKSETQVRGWIWKGK